MFLLPTHRSCFVLDFKESKISKQTIKLPSFNKSLLGIRHCVSQWGSKRQKTWSLLSKILETSWGDMIFIWEKDNSKMQVIGQRVKERRNEKEGDISDIIVVGLASWRMWDWGWTSEQGWEWVGMTSTVMISRSETLVDWLIAVEGELKWLTLWNWLWLSHTTESTNIYWLKTSHEADATPSMLIYDLIESSQQADKVVFLVFPFTSGETVALEKIIFL